MSLDESTLRKLRKKLDEIQIDLNEFLQKNYPDLAEKNIELIINEENFVEWTPEYEAVLSLRNTLQKDGKRVDKETITKKHISAAESLLRRGKCQNLAKEILVDAMSLTGKTVRYTVNLKDRLAEISVEEISKLAVIPLGNHFRITGGSQSTSSNSATIQVLIISEKGEPVHYNEPIDAFVHKILMVEEVDRDEIAELAAKALGEFEDDSSSDSFYNGFVGCEGNKCVYEWNGQIRKRRCQRCS